MSKSVANAIQRGVPDGILSSLLSKSFPIYILDMVMADGKMDRLIDIQAIAAEAFATLGTGRQIAPFSSRLSSFNLDDAYRVSAVVRQMRKARGETPLGRKIGFTNRTI